MRERCIALLLVLTPLIAQGQGNTSQETAENTEQTAVTNNDGDDPSITWVDDSHAYATDRAQELTEWMDSFFGDPIYELEKPESLIRLEWRNTWDEQDDYKSRLRLRGKVQLPALSERLELVFSGEDDDILADGQDDDDDRDSSAGFVYRVNERQRSRLDLTLGVKWLGLRPGIRYRNQGPIAQDWGYRFTQRVEWEDDEGFYSTGQFNLDHALSSDQLLRWSSRIIYGEETLGAEWTTGVSLRQKFETPYLHDPFVISYFTNVNGVSDPSRLENVSLGVLFRRQVFRPYFFAELEPSYNFRKREEDTSRSGVWNIVLRLEILFETQRRIVRSSDDNAGQPVPSADEFDTSRDDSEIFLRESRQP